MQPQSKGMYLQTSVLTKAPNLGFQDIPYGHSTSTWICELLAGTYRAEASQ